MQPWYRKSDDWWYFYECRIGRRTQVKLVRGKDAKKAAYDRWHEIACQPETKVSTRSIKHQIDVYLDHVQKNKAAGTYERCRHYLQSFVDHVGDVCNVQPRHVTAWINGKT